MVIIQEEEETKESRLSSIIHNLTSVESESSISKKRGRPKGSKNKNPPENTKS